MVQANFEVGAANRGAVREAQAVRRAVPSGVAHVMTQKDSQPLYRQEQQFES
ncbi:hypothetical protein [Paenibacillus agaridevorans]|uniref:hypothetical protein n=1 Tax=Paenibacillus agaridevorans TaxID=171404 RepID=UPI001BE49531|nr:hypothetical protein [Paenibacillus agaridevorans]